MHLLDSSSELQSGKTSNIAHALKNLQTDVILYSCCLMTHKCIKPGSFCILFLFVIGLIGMFERLCRENKPESSNEAMQGAAIGVAFVQCRLSALCAS